MNKKLTFMREKPHVFHFISMFFGRYDPAVDMDLLESELFSITTLEKWRRYVVVRENLNKGSLICLPDKKNKHEAIPGLEKQANTHMINLKGISVKCHNLPSLNMTIFLLLPF